MQARGFDFFGPVQRHESVFKGEHFCGLSISVSCDGHAMHTVLFFNDSFRLVVALSKRCFSDGTA